MKRRTNEELNINLKTESDKDETTHIVEPLKINYISPAMQERQKKINERKRELETEKQWRNIYQKLYDQQRSNSTNNNQNVVSENEESLTTSHLQVKTQFQEIQAASTVLIQPIINSAPLLFAAKPKPVVDHLIQPVVDPTPALNLTKDKNKNREFIFVDETEIYSRRTNK